MSNKEQYYTVKDLSEMWKMKIGFIRKEIRNGKLQCDHFGRFVRISQEQLNEYIENYVK